MGDILDQNEVDALLAAVEGGEVELPVEAGVAPAARLGRAPSAYDFKRPEPLAKDQVRALEVVHEVYARNLSSLLSGRLRTAVEVRLQTVEQVTWSEFVLSLPNPTCFCTVTGESLVGSLVLELNPAISFPLMELLLGATQPSPAPPERALTDLEAPIVRDLVGRVLGELEKIWAPIAGLRLRLAAMESNPQLVQLLAANEPVALLTFQVTVAEHQGRLNLCLPHVSLEPLLPRLVAHVGFGCERRAQDAEHQAALRANVSRAAVEARAVLVETTIRLSELMALEPGDVIATDRPADAPALLLVADRPKFLGKAGSVRGHRGFQVIATAGPS